MRKCHPFSKPYYKLYVFIFLFFIAGLTWIILNNLLMGHEIILCPVRRLFNVPCPGCGMTRAAMSILDGNIQEAIFYNANIIFVLPASGSCVMIAIYDIVFSKNLLYRCCNITNKFISSKFFLIIFFIFETFIVYHSIIYDIV